MVSLAGAFITCRERCGGTVAGWMTLQSVEDRLEELMDLFNAEVLSHNTDGARLKYHRQRVPLTRRNLCKAVYFESAAQLAPCLQDRISWADSSTFQLRDVRAFIDFLRSTFVWSRGCKTLPDSSDDLPRDVGHIPIPTTGDQSHARRECIENARVPVYRVGAGSGSGAGVGTSCMQHRFLALLWLCLQPPVVFVTLGCCCRYMHGVSLPQMATTSCTTSSSTWPGFLLRS